MKILVIRFSSAGDIILTSLFLRSLRRRFPVAEIHFLTKHAFASLVRHSEHVDRVITLEDSAGVAAALGLRKELLQENAERYDIVFDLHNSLRSRLVRRGLGARLAVFRKPTWHKWLLVHRKINRLRPIVSIAERYLAVGAPFGLVNDGAGLDLGIDGSTAPMTRPADRLVIALAPGARHRTKQWPAERFAELGRHLAQEFAADIVLLGGPDERALCASIAELIGESAHNLTGRTSWLQTAAALDACAVVVTNDSAISHLAAARKRPVVAVFGSTVQEFGFAPYGTESHVVEIEGLACRPCTTIGRAECPLGHFRCMEDITVEMVMKASRALVVPQHVPPRVPDAGRRPGS